MFMSWQTYESIRITTYSTIELIKLLLSNNVQYVFTERLWQDPLENYFGRQRSLGKRRDNPNIRTFGYQDNTIRTSNIFKPIASGNSRNKDYFECFSANELSRKIHKSFFQHMDNIWITEGLDAYLFFSMENALTL